MSPPSGSTLLKAFEHSVGAADDVRAERGVGLVQPRGQADAARNRIDFRDGVAGLRENEIGTDNERQVVAELFAAREFDQLGGFPASR